MFQGLLSDIHNLDIKRCLIPASLRFPHVWVNLCHLYFCQGIIDPWMISVNSYASRHLYIRGWWGLLASANSPPARSDTPVTGGGSPEYLLSPGKHNYLTNFIPNFFRQVSPSYFTIQSDQNPPTCHFQPFHLKPAHNPASPALRVCQI